jgi:hypothetical protein
MGTDHGVYIFSSPERILKVGGSPSGRVRDRVWEQQRKKSLGYWALDLPNLYVVEILPVQEFVHDGRRWVPYDLTYAVEAFLSHLLRAPNFRCARTYRGGFEAAAAYLSTLSSPCACEQCWWSWRAWSPPTEGQVFRPDGLTTALRCVCRKAPWRAEGPAPYVEALWNDDLWMRLDVKRPRRRRAVG